MPIHNQQSTINNLELSKNKKVNSATMKKLLILPALTCLMVMNFAFRSDIDPMQTLVQKLVEYYARFPQEKIYIQTDKPYYLGGESIWFRAYLVNASGHKPSTLSKKVYVELLNDSDSVVNRLLLNSADQKMNGSIHLPDSLQEGNYVLRAYTNWMLNFKSQYIFYKKLYIGSGINDLDLGLNFIMNKEGSRPSGIDLSLRDLNKKPLPRQTGTVQVFNDGKMVKQTIFTTDDQGKTNISLEDVQQNDWTKAQVRIKYKTHIQNFYPPKISDSLD